MIRFDGVRVEYEGHVALEGLDLAIDEGEFFTLLGPSGCGKTTALRALAGFVEPDRGSVEIDGRDVTRVPSERRGVGMVFQSYALFPSMSVRENIAFGLRVRRRPGGERRTLVDEVAEQVGLAAASSSGVSHELSGGQQQRVAIARALVLEPRILLLDEPLSNLDAKLRVQLRGELQRLQRELGVTTVYVTHDQEEALALSDRIAVLSDGTGRAGRHPGRHLRACRRRPSSATSSARRRGCSDAQLAALDLACRRRGVGASRARDAPRSRAHPPSCGAPPTEAPRRSLELEVAGDSAARREREPGRARPAARRRDAGGDRRGARCCATGARSERSALRHARHPALAARDRRGGRGHLVRRRLPRAAQRLAARRRRSRPTGSSRSRAVERLLSSERALRSLGNSLLLACTLALTVNVVGIFIVLVTQWFKMRSAARAVARLRDHLHLRRHRPRRRLQLHLRPVRIRHELAGDLDPGSRPQLVLRLLRRRDRHDLRDHDESHAVPLGGAREGRPARDRGCAGSWAPAPGRSSGASCCRRLRADDLRGHGAHLSSSGSALSRHRSSSAARTSRPSHR